MVSGALVIDTEDCDACHKHDEELAHEDAVTEPASPLPSTRGEESSEEKPMHGEPLPPPSASEEEDEEEDFDVFDRSVSCSYYCPIIVFSDDVSEQKVWRYGSVREGRVGCPRERPDVLQKDPVVMSPAYLGFTVEPWEERYLHYRGVGIVFRVPDGGRFMQPSIDTLLLCYGLARLFDKCETSFHRIIDVGAGSGFIGKFAAEHAPGRETLCVSLIDIDPAAQVYWESKSFGAWSRTRRGRGISWSFLTNDAIVELEKDAGFDLIISNPPYIPTIAEVMESEGAAHMHNFWEGCGLLIRLMELFIEGRYPANAHLVVAITSLTLKSRRVRALLEKASASGVRVEQLVEREIAWKAWYAGTGTSPKYLLASDEEVNARQRIGDNKFFVGAMRPGESRSGGAHDRLWGYHWHVAYVLDFSRHS